jgi:hypothetical protein
MHPLYVNNYTAGTNPVINVIGKAPHTVRVISDDIVARNVIHPFHDMYLVKAGVAYVDANSTFILADVTTEDWSDASGANYLPGASDVPRGYRVEGIKAVHFEEDERTLTVWVLAEGDNAVTDRNSGAARQAIINNDHGTGWTWTADCGVTFEPEVYYEEFSMVWRTRNIESAGP